MSEADGEGDGGGSGRFPKRGRVTLKWNAPPLRLPGEDDPAEHSVAESTELEIPDFGGEEMERPPSIPPPGEDPVGVDGWDRQRPVGRGSGRSPSGTEIPEAGDALDGAALDGGALSLVDQRSRPSSPTIDLAAEMNDRYALGDYTAALRAAELILGRLPDHAEARKVSMACRERLAQLYGSRLGSLGRTPTQAVEEAEVRWLGLDHRAGFLLSRVDGAHTVEQLLDISGMPRLEALKTLVELLDMGAIRLSD